MALFLKKITFLAICFALCFSFFQESKLKNHSHNDILFEQSLESEDNEVKNFEISNNLNEDLTFLRSKFLPKESSKIKFDREFSLLVPTSPPKSC